PLGSHFKKPSDKLGHKVAATILTSNSARDRLTQGVFIPENQNEILSKLGRAFEKAVKAEDIEKKLGKAAKEKRIAKGDIDAALSQGIITADDVALLRDLKELTRDVIMVD